jgi:hypothetical protein
MMRRPKLSKNEVVAPEEEEEGVVAWSQKVIISFVTSFLLCVTLSSRIK